MFFKMLWRSFGEGTEYAAASDNRNPIAQGLSVGWIWLSLLSAVGIVLPVDTDGRDLFVLTAESEGTVATRGFSNVKRFLDELSEMALMELIPGYTPSASARMVLDVRGLPALAEYPADSTALQFAVPSLGIDLSFAGATRDESRELFVDFLKGEGESILTRLLQGLVSETAVDPVAGNPNSLMAQMAQRDFAVSSADGLDRKMLGIGLMAGRSEASGFHTNMFTLPINYVVTLPDPRFLFIVDAPLRYVNVEGGEVFDGSLGLGLRIPLFERPEAPALRWSVTPVVRAGVVESFDLGSLQAAYSASATSKLEHARGDLLFTLNNMLGYYKTGTVARGWSGDYDLTNQIFRNGLKVEGSLGYQLFQEPATWEIQYVNTQIAGDDWFIDNYNEIAATVGTRRRDDRENWQIFRVGAKYTFADEYDGFQLVLGYRF